MNKKYGAIALASFLLLAGCGTGSNNKNTEVENKVGKEKAAKIEERVVEGEIASIGYGFDIEMKGKSLEGEKGPEAQADGYGLAIAFDKDGKIVDAKFDAIQPKVTFNADQSLEENKEEIKSKVELGHAYGMAKASSIDKEWYEQAYSFEEYIIGKTPEEVENIPTKVKDEFHPNVADDPDLVSSVTIDIGNFMKLVQEASENKMDIDGANKIALNLDASVSKSKGLEGEMGPKAWMNILMGVVALDEEGKIVASKIDEAEAIMEFDSEGKMIEKDPQVKSKRDLGDEYGMKEASKVQKEWDEQLDAFEDYILGKSRDEIEGIPVKKQDDEKAIADDADLTSSVTVYIKDYQNLILEAMDK